ncbi:aminoglycoside adenylyltransferase family protein [Streptomyces sp. NPDC050504]|uniref:aminoglycoside adenylyltransferase family protein n=1 Tax=Streptomyces sp. NPDC050504 TaxID=3365618 RepID=UPI00379DC34C
MRHVDRAGRDAEQTGRVVRVVEGALGPAVIGMYRHGSATFGGLRPHSDIDVLVAVRRRITDAERAALTTGLLAVSSTSPDGPRPVELCVVAQHDVRPWRSAPHCDFLYGEWLREEFERGGAAAPGPSDDLAPLITMVLRGDSPLTGPPPGEVFAPVPPDELRRAIVAGVPELLAELEWDTRNVLLTLARVWSTLVTGGIRSKDAAADWALERLPDEHRAVLVHARDVYRGEALESWERLAPAVLPHAEHVVAEIREATKHP